MSLKFITKFFSILPDRSSFTRTQSRNFGKKKKKAEKEKCPNKTCGDSKPKKKKSFWRMFGSEIDPEELKANEECCRQNQAPRQGCQPDPDLSEFGGTPYKTCGSAYVIQKDLVDKPPSVEEPEDKLLEKLERHPALKDVEDPMPPFESVEQRLLKLCELKLHPAYKRYMSIPRPMKDLTMPKHVYKTRSGPIAEDEYPPHLKLSRECLDRKNIFAEFKRAEPPRQLLAKMIEMRQNERPTLEKKTNVSREGVNGEVGARDKVKCQ